MKKDNISTCQRCQSIFECKANDIANCQCATFIISEATQQYLSTTDYGCLCKKCIIEINQSIENPKSTEILPAS